MLTGSLLLLAILTPERAAQASALPPRIPLRTTVQIEGTEGPRNCAAPTARPREIERYLHSWNRKTWIDIDGSEQYDLSDCYLKGVARYHGQKAEFKYYNTDVIEVHYPDGQFGWLVPPRRHP